MTPKDRQAFFELIAGVYGFYGKEFSTFTGGVWWEAMKPFDLAAVKDALNRHAVNPDSGQFLPRPADVIRMLQGSTQDSALVAWAKVDRAIRTVGMYRSVAFDDALIHRVITEMGGWIALGTKDDSEWPFLKNEFVNRYRGYRGRNEIPEYPPVLTGIAEASNSQNEKIGCRHIEPPTLIGDPAIASDVALGGSGKQIVQISSMPKSVSDVLQLSDERGAA
jgi:hypothetical protein